MNTVNILTTRGNLEALVPGDKGEVRICWAPNKSSFYLKWKCAGHWYYQWLMWQCRAGKKSYYRPMVALYRQLRRDGKVKPGMLRNLAS